MILEYRYKFCRWAVALLVFGCTYPAIGQSISKPRNSMVSKTVTAPISDPAQLNTSNSIAVVQYLDGLGRGSIMAVKSVTPAGKDLVSMQSFDCAGTVTRQWLPAPVPSSASAPDADNVMAQAKSFYADQMPYASVYTTKTADNSGEDVKNIKPGAFRYNGDKAQKAEIICSDPSNPLLYVRIYEVEGDRLVVSSDPLDIFNCRVTRYTDEDNQVTLVFEDLDGKILLQRKVNANVNHDTYYAYDKKGQLRFVLSPEASDKITAEGSYSLAGISGPNDPNSPLAQYGYAYNYDERGNCIAKKLPGRDWVKMIYDKAGRLVFSQDGNQRRENKWTFIKYDPLGRPVQSGVNVIYDEQAMREAYRNAAMQETYVTGSGYTANSPMGTTIAMLTQNFYDSYDYLNLPEYASIKGILGYSQISGFDPKFENLVNGTDLSTRNAITGTAVAMLDGSSTLVTSYYYDDKGRVVQSHSNNHLGGYDHDYFHYNFSGSVLNKRHVHKTPYVSSEITENYRMVYDNAGRLTLLAHRLNTQAEVAMAAFTYDELGRPTKKVLHGGVQNINYTYNIQNQLKSVSSEGFAETLYYHDSPDATPRYNGSISAVEFGTEPGKSWVVEYDPLNRLMKSTSSGHSGLFYEQVGGYDKNGNIKSLSRTGYVLKYSTMMADAIDKLTLTYNGNQLAKVSDDAIQGSVYTNNDFVDKQDTRYPQEYLYDANGNMTADLNRGIAWIQYNLLNLPDKIQFRNYTKNEYVYDALGVKHRAKYYYSTGTSLIPLGDTSTGNTASSSYQLDYCGNYVYEKSGLLTIRLKRILLPEGSVETYLGNLAYLSSWKYDYFLKDHQGNTRVVLSKAIGSGSASASGQVDYYPFGMEQSRTTATSGGPLYSSDTPPYLYSGNELEKMNGLNQYDFHARWLDNAVPRFTTMDPLAEAHYDESPYVYCGNDPVNQVDPLGLDWYYNQEGEFPKYIKGHEDNKNYKHHDKTRMLESDHYKYFFGEYGSIYIVEKMTGSINGFLPEPQVMPTGTSLSYNVYSYESLNTMMGNGRQGAGLDDLHSAGIQSFGIIFDTGAAMYGAGELGIKYLRNNQGAKSLGRAIGFGTQRTAEALKGTANFISKTGKALGTAGYVANGLVYAGKLMDGTATTADHVSMGVSTGLIVAGSVLTGTVVAPYIAAAGLVYGLIEIGSFLYNGKSIEENMLH